MYKFFSDVEWLKLDDPNMGLLYAIEEGDKAKVIDYINDNEKPVNLNNCIIQRIQFFPLVTAVANGRLEILSLLLEKKAQDNSPVDSNAIRLAIEKKSDEAAFELINSNNNDDENYLYQALITAVHFGREKVVEMLLSEKKVVDKITYPGPKHRPYTALTIALENGRSKIALAILERMKLPDVTLSAEYLELAKETAGNKKNTEVLGVLSKAQPSYVQPQEETSDNLPLNPEVKPIWKAAAKGFGVGFIAAGSVSASLALALVYCVAPVAAFAAAVFPPAILIIPAVCVAAIACGAIGGLIGGTIGAAVEAQKQSRLNHQAQTAFQGLLYYSKANELPPIALG